MAEKELATHRIRPPLVWDETGLVTTYVNRAEVSTRPGEVLILFGIEPAPMAHQDRVELEPSRLIALDPVIAKRLAMSLGRLVRGDQVTARREELGSTIDVSTPGITPSACAAKSGEEERLEKIMTLFHCVGQLDAEVDFELSFKMSEGNLEHNRFLLGVNRSQVKGHADQRIAAICDTIDMPANLVEAFCRKLCDANHVYFGVEKGEDTLILKAYLEYRDKIERQIRGADVGDRSFSLFTGFKWDIRSPSRQSVTRYSWLPSLTVPDMMKRSENTLQSLTSPEFIELIQGVTRHASQRLSPRDIQYLEVTEEGNPRQSFDINLYKSGQRLVDLSHYLIRAAAHCGVDADRFQTFYERIRNERLGHFAAGIGRNDRAFVTVYYGAKKISSAQLRSARVAPR